MGEVQRPDGPPARGEQAPAAPRRRARAALAWLRAALVLGAVVAADQLTKRAVERSIVPGEERKVLPGIELVDTRNRGVAFGLFPGDHVVVTALVSFALLVLLAYFALHATRALTWLPTGLIAGGALGNVVDRLRHGSVIDFIKLPLGWPPFNLADASITLGVVILFVLVDHARHARSRAHAMSPRRT
ncbi:MAG TPA: signal peptidase II [Solirubrobacteraceae bacterium]|nr:signal peptidase II [Solirubrobacteraceae bacterium]